MSRTAAAALVDALRHPDPALPANAIRSTAFDHPSDSSQVITSWKVAEHLYRSHTTLLPTLARGLFTTGEPGKEIIVGRGYDKFFNVDEVAYTSWNALEQHTSGPYSLTLKSNGCLILLSALSPSTLLVTSKHALDTVGEDEEDGYRGGHARVGREWVKRHLERAGRTEEDLAAELWTKGVSGVAELCDDTFEEHVLPYPPHLTGLHLHGLLPTTPAFASLPPSEVADFARRWGFIPTRFVELATVADVRKYAEDVEEKGEWDGERVEGFVVRCTVAPLAPSSSSSSSSSPAAATRPPYEFSSPFFFKIKFQQPYLLYRSFREITKSLLPILDDPSRAWAGTPWSAGKPTGGVKQAFVMTDEMKAEAERKKAERKELKERAARGEVVDSGKSVAKAAKESKKSSTAGPSDTSSSPAAAAPPKKNSDPIKLPGSQIRYPESLPYSYFVRSTMLSHPEWYAEYAKSKGIIRVREEFLRWVETEEGKAMMDEEKEKGRWKRKEAGAGGKEKVDGQDKQWGKTLILPVAIPGCGKTAIGLVLKELYGWAHVQSDDVKTRKTGPEFNKNVGTALKSFDVVIADRNNHLAQHRQELEKTASTSTSTPTRLIALNFPLSPPLQSLPQHTLHRLCSSRITSRGDRHQTLRAQEGNVKRHEDILWRFFVTAEKLEDDEVDDVINLRIEDTLEANLKIVLERLHELLHVEIPSAERLQAALEKVKSYDPDVRKTLMEAATRSDATRYFSVAPEVSLVQMAEDVIAGSSAAESTKAGARAFLKGLADKGRITTRPHITVVHESEVEAERLEALSVTDSPAPKEDGPMKKCWDACTLLANPPGSSFPTDVPLFEFTISHLVFSEKVMSLVISSLRPSPQSLSCSGPLASVLESLVVPDIEHAHFTIGTPDESIRPFEGRLLVREKRKEGMSGEGVLEVGHAISGQGRVVGLS